jgi:prophage antirepressor-like protein
MNTNIQIFTSEIFGEIRTCQVNNQIMFVGKDVAQALGYSDPQKAIKMHVDDDDKLTRQIVVSGQRRAIILINESGLYSLILSSQLPQAKAFKRWVTSEVLPAIRQTGRYELTSKELRLLGAKADYCDEVLLSVDCVTTTQVAKELGMTGSELYRWLIAMSIVYWQSGEYMLYADFARMGYAKSRTHSRRNRLGIWHTDRYLVWTEKGRKFLHEVFEKKEALA